LVLLGQHNQDEIALGLVGKFWRPVIEFAAVTSPTEFREFAEPGFAKTIPQYTICGCRVRKADGVPAYAAVLEPQQ
jgi:hypothetical protein